MVLHLKVGQGSSISKEISVFSKEIKSAETSSFQQILTEKQTNFAKEQLNTLLEDINKQGEKLGRSRTLKDLHHYKKLIKSFLQQVVKFGLSLEETSSFSSMNNRERKLKVINEIDTHLLKLSKDVLETEDQNIRLLDRMGEIKGLLIDLYL